jgi:hypothetical protein
VSTRVNNNKRDEKKEAGQIVREIRRDQSGRQKEREPQRNTSEKAQDLKGETKKQVEWHPDTHT